VVIRILHRGHGRVARKLVGLSVTHVNAESHAPQAGDPIEADGKTVGHVTSGAVSPALGRPIALGYVHRDFIEPAREVIILSDAHPLRAVVTALPFR
jgi:glycine cleavage system aminomethyltransferase T